MENEQTEHIIAFIDILGFKNLLKSPKETTNAMTTISGTLDKLRELWRDINPKHEIKTTIFSDSIILAYDLNKRGDASNRYIFEHFCIAVGQLQAELVSQNVWVRGAVTCGDLYFPQVSIDTIIYGSGFVRAYELESQHAIYPRIIIDTKIIKKLQYQNRAELIKGINKNCINGEYGNWNGSLIYDVNLGHNPNGIRFLENDVHLFIDYIQPIMRIKNTETSSIKLISLDKVIKNLSNKILEADNSSIYKKYQWVIDYIKQTIETERLLKADNRRYLNDTEISELYSKIWQI